MKIVLNRKFGGFGLSDEAILLYGKLAGIHLTKEVDPEYVYSYNWKTDAGDFFFEFDLDRQDSNLIKVVEELGDKSFGEYARLEVVEVPDDVTCWEINSYDGAETVVECHRSW